MAYKSKRTRDLQGEVQAGTNVSVSETTKPDGTKVYTLSAEGGEITISGSGLQLVGNVLTNLMAQRMGWTDESMGKINWTDDNGDDILVIDPLEKIFIGDADDGASFFIKQLDSIGAHKLISGDIEIAENEASTEGISLQTLADTLMDMTNSASLWFAGNNNSFTYSSVFYLIYSFFWEIPPYPNYTDNVYFEENTQSGYTIDNNELSGLLVKESGVYKINLSGFTYCIISGVDLENPIELHLGVIRNNGYVTLRDFATFANKLPNGANSTHSINFSDVGGIFKLEANDVIVSYISLYSNNTINGNGFQGDNPILSIQKVR